MEKMSKKSLIINAAIELFAEKGFHHASIYEIAQKAGVATGLLYSKYFTNKLDLLLSINIQFWKDVNHQLKEKIRDLSGPQKKLTEMWHIIHNTLMKDKKTLHLSKVKVLHEALPHCSLIKDVDLRKKRIQITEENRKFLKLLDDVIDEGKERGVFSKTHKTAVLRQMLYGAIEMTLYGLFLKTSKEGIVGYNETDVQKAIEGLIDEFICVKG
jgi:TetR/AcrR family transcriptional regulator, fatty acid metabolism regulator protein